MRCWPRDEKRIKRGSALWLVNGGGTAPGPGGCLNFVDAIAVWRGERADWVPQSEADTAIATSWKSLEMWSVLEEMCGRGKTVPLVEPLAAVLKDMALEAAERETIEPDWATEHPNETATPWHAAALETQGACAFSPQDFHCGVVPDPDGDKESAIPVLDTQHILTRQDEGTLILLDDDAHTARTGLNRATSRVVAEGSNIDTTGWNDMREEPNIGGHKRKVRRVLSSLTDSDQNSALGGNPLEILRTM
jgi:hypothetical protein